MKTIGLIGGLSWHSSIDYYSIINNTVNKRLGGNEAATLIMYSVNYGEIVSLTRQGDWDRIAAIICNAAWKTDRAGADCILLCANTMHKIADRVQQAISCPLIHIATETAKAVQQKGIKKVALLGTIYTMQLGFYPEKLWNHDIEMMIPDESDRKMVSDVIYDELGKGIFLPETKQKYLAVINKLVEAGAEGVILGCTEIPMLLKQEDCPVPVFDTAMIHATAAVDFALR